MPLSPTTARRRRFRSRTLAFSLVALLGSAGLTTAGLVGTAAEAADAARDGCGMGTGGPNASTICWIDFSDYDDVKARSAAGQPMSIKLPGGYEFDFTLKTSGAAATLLSTQVSPLPTYPGAIFGNQVYVGTPGKPALTTHGLSSGTHAGTFSLDDITVKDSAGEPVGGFALVSGDAEATDSGEGLAWHADTPLTLVDKITPPDRPDAGGCQATVTGFGTHDVSCTGVSSTSGVDGSLLLQAVTPTTFSATTKNAGLSAQAFAVGFMIADFSDTGVSIANRVAATDSAEVSLKSPEGTVIGSASTGTGDTASTGEISVLPRSSGSSYSLTAAMAPGSPSPISNYDTLWSCSNAATGSDTPLPGGAGAVKTVQPKPGDAITCSVALTGKTSGIALTHGFEAPVDVDHDGFVSAGDTIAPTFHVTNTGTLPLDAVAIAGSTMKGITCPTAVLAPGVAVDCTAEPHVLTQAEVDAGTLTDKATASGMIPGGTAAVSSAASTATATIAEHTGLGLTASTRVTPDSKVGDEVSFDFAAENTSNVTLKDVALKAGAFTGHGETPRIVCPASDIAPGAMLECSATYTLEQADIDAGSISFAATASATSMTQGTAVASAVASSDSDLASTTGIDVKASTTATTSSKVGDEVSFDFTVENTGTATLKEIALTPGAFTGHGTAPSIECPAAGDLAPGAKMTCHATYIVTQADVDAGSISFAASAKGTSAGGAVAVASDEAVAGSDLPSTTGADLTATTTATTASKVSDKVTFDVVVTNTGTGSFAAGSIETEAFTGHGVAPKLACPIASELAPSASLKCTAEYTLTQADIDAGSVSLTAVFSGVGANGKSVSKTASAGSAIDRTVELGLSASIAATKKVSTSLVKPGETVNYESVVTNTGNTSITNLAVDSTTTGSGSAALPECVAHTLAPGESTTCLSSLVLTQVDIDAGGVTTTFVAKGTGPVTETAVLSPEAKVVLPETVDAGLTIDGSTPTKSVTKSGDTISYRFVVTNTGGVSLEGASVAPKTFSGAGKPSAVTCDATAKKLLPGQSVTCTATYTVTDGDLSVQSIELVASAEAKTQQGKVISSVSKTISVAVLPAPELAFTGWGFGPTHLAAIFLSLVIGLILLVVSRRRSI